jgi:hypothetical protein
MRSFRGFNFTSRFISKYNLNNFEYSNTSSWCDVRGSINIPFKKMTLFMKMKKSSAAGPVSLDFAGYDHTRYIPSAEMYVRLYFEKDRLMLQANRAEETFRVIMAQWPELEFSVRDMQAKNNSDFGPLFKKEVAAEEVIPTSGQPPDVVQDITTTVTSVAPGKGTRQG